MDKFSKDQGVKHKIGDAIERVGEKLSDMGASKIGQKVSQAGNKIEHADDVSAKKATSTSSVDTPKKY
jgi:hypothetical protein